MKRNSQLSRVLHLLMHLSLRNEPVTSEDLARSIDTNPVVVRQIMAGLRQRGYVESIKGHGGGWRLACELAQVTLHDVYTALGSPPLLALSSPEEDSPCRVAQTVEAALARSYQDAEAVLLARLSEVSLGELRADLEKRLHHGP